MNAKNLIMGLWSGLPFSGLEKFLASLQSTSYDGDVCVFVDQVEVGTVETLVSRGVIVEQASPFYAKRMSVPVSRYFNYLDFLARHSGCYSHVMISDLRDVIFQADPFAAPLPADLIFAQERCRLRDCATTGGWVKEVYGDEIAYIMRQWPISCSGTTFGTVSAMLEYLALMVHEFARVDIPLFGGLDQGIHNYIIRMRPPLNAWFDPTDSLVATLHYMPEAALAVGAEGILIEGRVVPVIHQWDRRPMVAEYVETAPRFSLTSAGDGVHSWSSAPTTPRFSAELAAVAQTSGAADAIICYYDANRSVGWLEPFLASARGSGFRGSIFCVGDFDGTGKSTIERYGGQVLPIQNRHAALDAENEAHLFMRSALDELSRHLSLKLGHVLLIDTVCATFCRDPFLTKTIGLSVFAEGPASIGDSAHNMEWLNYFVSDIGAYLDKPIVSSSVLRGPIEVVQLFTRKLLAEYAGQAELLYKPKSTQGAFNKLCHAGNLDYPVTIYPNGSIVYFEIWPTDVPIQTQPIIRVAGTLPSIIVNPLGSTGLTNAARGALGIT
jgi:hypothetical protein